MEYTFKLTEAEAQILLNALVKEPYMTVAELIAKIQAQATEQQKANESAK
jgi:hypothetical protein